MKARKGSILIAGGLLLIAAALILATHNFWDDSRASKYADSVAVVLQESLPTQDSSVDDIPAYILNPEMEMPTTVVDGQRFVGLLEVPSLDLTLPVASEWSYPALKESPCRYFGSAYSGNFVIAAHNYDSHFGRLKSLSEGETVIFTDADGNRFAYEVVMRETLEPTAIEEFTESDWNLTLFTCTLGGDHRIAVRCTLTPSWFF